MLQYAPFAPGAPQADGRPSADAAVAIRPATGADVPGIVAVAAMRGERPPEYAERVAAWVADAERCVLAAVAVAPGAVEADGHDRGDDASTPGGVVGWAMVSCWAPDDAPEGHVVSALTVDPSWWRRGVGSRLMTGLLAWTWQRADHLWSIVNVRNEASLALHRGHGFIEVRRAAGVGGVTFDGGEGLLLCAAHAGDRAPTIPQDRALRVADPTDSSGRRDDPATKEQSA